MKTNSIRPVMPGLLLSLAVASVAYLAGTLVPVVGGAVFALVFGIAFGHFAKGFARGNAFLPGTRFTGKKVLQYSIVLLGFEMDISKVLRVGSQSLFIMLFTLSAAFVTAALMGRLLKMPSNEKILVGVGTSICGGSAIAATAPVIGAKDEEVAQSISTIFLFNIVAVFLFPALGHLLGMSDKGFGVWAGTAVNDTSSVVAAASAWSQAAGNGEALSLATIVKLTRTLMIVPITVFLAVRTARKERREDSLSSFSFVRVFPWFVLGFVAAAVAASTLPIPASVDGALVRIGKYMIVMAMAAIGLNTDLRRLLANGRKPILLGLSCWTAVALVSLLVQALTGMR